MDQKEYEEAFFKLQEKEHEPAPWIHGGGCIFAHERGKEGFVKTIASFGDRENFCTNQAIADAAFAVHAVNNHKDLVTELDTLIKRYEAATGFEAISARSALRRAKSC